MMIVRPLPIAWRPELPIHASRSFLQAIAANYGWIGGYDPSGELRCFLPYTITRKALVRMARFHTETLPVGNELTVHEERQFLNAVVKYFQSGIADVIIPPSTNAVFRVFPDGAIAAPYGTYILDLTQPEQTLWEGLHSKHRNVVRSATRKGVQVRRGVEFATLAGQLIRDTLKRSNLGFHTPEAFARYVEQLRGFIEIFVADFQGQAQGCAVVPYSNYGAYYVYGGSVPAPVTGAMNLLHWEAIRHFKEAGVRRYDFVGTRISPEKGSKQDGLRVFKERFGGTLAEGFLWKFPLNRLKYFVYAIGVRLQRHGDIVDQERHKLPLAPGTRN